MFLSAHANEDAFPVGQLQLEIDVFGSRENFAYFSHWWATRGGRSVGAEPGVHSTLHAVRCQSCQRWVVDSSFLGGSETCDLL